MSDLRKAAEMALEVLEEINKLSIGENAVFLPGEIDGAMEALRQALAQPEQEQYVTKVVAMHEDGTYTTERIPLPKREWVGVTDEEIWETEPYKMAVTDQETRWLYRFAKTIEAKLKEKNT